MKARIAIFSLVLLAVASLWGVFHQVQEVKAQSLTTYQVRYESGGFGVSQGEMAEGWVVNADSVSHNARVVIYRFSGTSLVVVSDTGTQSVSPTFVWQVSSSPELGAIATYTVEITTDSDKLIPSVNAQTPGCDPSCHVPRIELHGTQLLRFKQEF